MRVLGREGTGGGGSLGGRPFVEEVELRLRKLKLLPRGRPERREKVREVSVVEATSVDVLGGRVTLMEAARVDLVAGRVLLLKSMLLCSSSCEGNGIGGGERCDSDQSLRSGRRSARLKLAMFAHQSILIDFIDGSKSDNPSSLSLFHEVRHGQGGINEIGWMILTAVSHRLYAPLGRLGG
jgi:hypothetical protein